MRLTRSKPFSVAIVLCCAGSVTGMTLDEALNRLPASRFGQENEAINTIRRAAVDSFDDPASRRKLTSQLAAVLESDATEDAKRFACRQLALIGTENEVPPLAKLLTNKRLSQTSRYALARIPGEAADRALLEALNRTDSVNQLGIICTLGNRRCGIAVEPLTGLLGSDRQAVAHEAARALGRIGTPAAARVLWKALLSSDEPAAELVRAALDCADQLWVDGNPDEARRTWIYVAGCVSHLPGHVRGAAMNAGPWGPTTDQILYALRHDDERFRDAGAQAARSVSDPMKVRALAAALPSLPARSKVLLIHALAEGDDVPLPDAVAAASESDDPRVRIAALEAMQPLGDATSVPILLQAAAEGSEAERAVAQNSLARLRDEAADEALIARAKAADPSEQIAALSALTARGAVETVPAILKIARSEDRQVRSAAIEALGELATGEHIPTLVELLMQADAGEQDRVRKILVVVADRCQARRKTSETLMNAQTAGADPSVRASLLMALGELGDASALPVLRSGLTGEEPAVRRAAIQALGAWPNGEPLPDLLQVAREASDRTHRVLALRGYVALVGRADSMSPRERVQCCETAMSLATDGAEKRRVFALLPSVNGLDALQLAASYVADEQVADEAALAAVTIAEQIYAADPKPVESAMERVLDADIGDGAKERAKKVLDDAGAIRNCLTAWEVAGPYEKEGANYADLFDVAFGPERSGAEVQWRPIAVRPLEAHPAYVDLLDAFGGEQRVAYLRTEIESPEPSTATLEIFSDDGVKAWLNGKRIHANNIARPIPTEPDRVNVSLRKGTNTLMLKVTQNNLPWGAIVRVREARPVEPKVGDGWRLHTINAESQFEAAGILDVNRDGKLDILCGGYWYEAPAWERHFVREIKEQGGYYHDFANLPMDVDGDGWTDTVGAAWHNKMVYWVRNPGEKGGPWEVFEVDTPGNMETALAYDINGDGRTDVLPNIMKAAAWYAYHQDASMPQGVRWEKHVLPQEAAGHGLGAGDVNRDGRCDIVTPRGWLEQTAGGWQWHPEFELGHASIPILVHDVDRDGDSDLIWGLGHNYGLFWLEQKRGEERSWQKHRIDDSWSQPHFLFMADLDNDGREELVTGKRYHAHNGKDPGGNEPPCVYYYAFDTETGKWARHLMHEGGRAGLGINTGAADIDGDGDLDVVAPGKSGLYLFENRLKQ